MTKKTKKQIEAEEKLRAEWIQSSRNANPFDMKNLSKKRIFMMKAEDSTEQQIKKLQDLGMANKDIAKLNKYTASLEITERLRAQPMSADCRKALIEKFGVDANIIPEDASYGLYLDFTDAIYNKKANS